MCEQPEDVVGCDKEELRLRKLASLRSFFAAPRPVADLPMDVLIDREPIVASASDADDAAPAVSGPSRQEQVRAAWAALPGSILEKILRDMSL